MRLITPLEFPERYSEGQTLAIVGNAPSVLEYGLGDCIDDHDVVVRFNECPVSGYEQHVGRRTSILVTNPYRETAKRPLLVGATPDMVLVINPQTRRGDLEGFKNWVGDSPVLFTYTPDLIGVEDPGHSAGLTTGTFAVHLLWRLLRPKKLLLTGFEMFKEGNRGHYWQQGLPSGLRAHDLKREGEIFVNILNSIPTRVNVTRDVFELSARFGIRFRRHVRLYEKRKSSLWPMSLRHAKRGLGRRLS